MEIENKEQRGNLLEEEGSLCLSFLENTFHPASLSSESSIEEEEIEIKRKEDGNEVKGEEETFTCQICFEEYPLSEGVVLPCDHTYCPECVQMFVFQFLQSGKVSDIRCPDPNCDSKAWTGKEIGLVFASPAIALTMPDGKTLTPEEIQQRFVRFKMLAEANAGGEAHRPCRSPECDGLLVVGDAQAHEAGKVVCRLCDAGHCGECFYIHREGESCKDAKKRTQKENYKKSNSYKRKRQFRIAAKAFFPTIFTRCSLFIKPNVQRCPKCHKFIEKWYGCRYMRCSSCKTSFCWLCGAKGVNHGNKDHCKFNKVTWPIRLVFAAIFSAVYIPVMLLPFLGVVLTQRFLSVEFERGPRAFVDNFYFCNERLAGFPY